MKIPNFKLVLMLFLCISLIFVIPITPIYAPSDGGSSNDDGSGGPDNSGSDGDGNDNSDDGKDSEDSEADTAADDCDAADPSCTCGTPDTRAAANPDATVQKEETGFFGMIEKGVQMVDNLISSVAEVIGLNTISRAIGGVFGLDPETSGKIGTTLVGLAFGGFSVTSIATTVLGFVGKNVVGSLAEMERTGSISSQPEVAESNRDPKAFETPEEKENSRVAESIFRSGENDITNIVAKSIFATGQPFNETNQTLNTTATN